MLVLHVKPRVLVKLEGVLTQAVAKTQHLALQEHMESQDHKLDNKKRNRCTYVSP